MEAFRVPQIFSFVYYSNFVCSVVSHHCSKIPLFLTATECVMIRNIRKKTLNFKEDMTLSLSVAPQEADAEITIL